MCKALHWVPHMDVSLFLQQKFTEQPPFTNTGHRVTEVNKKQSLLFKVFLLYCGGDRHVIKHIQNHMIGATMELTFKTEWEHTQISDEICKL